MAYAPKERHFRKPFRAINMPLYSEMNYMDKLNGKIHSVMKHLVTQMDEASGAWPFEERNKEKTTGIAAPQRELTNSVCLNSAL